MHHPPLLCRQHYLHLRNLQEASALRRQLALAVLRQRAATGAPEETAQRQRELGELMQPLPSPRALIAQQLRKALAAGWADQVRLAPASQHVSFWSSRKQHGLYVQAHRAKLDGRCLRACLAIFCAWLSPAARQTIQM